MTIDLTSLVFSEVHNYTAPEKLFNHSHSFNLPYIANYCLIKVSTTANNVDWLKAGYLEQYSIDGENKVYLGRTFLFLDRVTLVELSPSTNTQLTYIPVGWLYDWSIEVRASEYIGSPLNQVDIRLLAIEETLVDLTNALASSGFITALFVATTFFSFL